MAVTRDPSRALQRQLRRERKELERKTAWHSAVAAAWRERTARELAPGDVPLSIDEQRAYEMLAFDTPPRP